ncbi:MAG: hypothetical protein GXW85_03105, partial [Clostridia bacterium]|nr:hypothetical protein [Clostridia bacterium]
INIGNTIILNEEKLKKGTKRNELIGRIYYYNNDTLIGSVPLYTATETINNHENKSYWLKILQLIKEKTS